MKHQRSLYAKQKLCESSTASEPTSSCCTPHSSFLCLSSPQLMKSICMCLGGHGCALTVLCWTMLEQNPLRDLPAWPVGHPSCSPRMAALCALPATKCTAQLAAVPASLTGQCQVERPWQGAFLGEPPGAGERFIGSQKSP